MGENNVYRYLNITALPKFSWLIFLGGRMFRTFVVSFYTPHLYPVAELSEMS